MSETKQVKSSSYYNNSNLTEHYNVQKQILDFKKSETYEFLIQRNPEKIKASICIAVIIIVVHALYSMRIIKRVPCNKNISDILAGNFVHIDMKHVISNIYGIYIASILEQEYGTRYFMKIVVFIIILSSSVENLIRKKSRYCTIGYSGVIFGIITFYSVKKRERLLSLFLLSAVFLGSLKENVSNVGHLIGIASGLIASIIF